MSVQTLRPWVPSNTFGTRLVLIRRELGLNVKQAAAKTGLHYATWSTWENGRTPADMAEVVEKISTHLGVDREWLMWGQTSRNPQPDGPGEGVRHQGLEPRTRWLRVFASDLPLYRAA